MSQHIVDQVTKKVTDWYVGALPLEDQDRASALIRDALTRERIRGGLVPVPARSTRAPCGCDSPLVVVDDAGVEVCSACST